MKKVCLYLITIFLGVLPVNIVSGQLIWFTSVPDSSAIIDELYTYDANVYSSASDTSFILETAPAGMSINSSNGLISWTPTGITDGGKVVIRASNSGNSVTQEFYIYITGPPDCDASTIAYWELDEEEGPVYKDSYGTHNASVSVNEPGDSAGIVGKCQKFTPWPFIEMTAPDHSDFDFDPDQSFSISFWLRTTEPDLDSTSVLIGRNDGTGNTHWWIGIDTNNVLTFLVRDFSKPPDNFSETFISGNRLYYKHNIWHHAVAVHDADADRLRIYFNGSSDNHYVNYNAHNSPGFSATSPLCIGFLNKAGDSHQYPFHGSLDEMIIFNKALTPAEIDTLYNRGISGRPACDQGNAAPLFRSEPVTVGYEDVLYSYQLFADDINAGDALTYSAEKNPAWLNFNAGTGTLSGTPDNNDIGSDSVVIKVNDGSIDIYQRFLLTVINTNDPPVITSSEITTVNEEEPYSYDADADDIDPGDNLTFSLQPPTPGWLSVNASSGLITGTPPVDDTSSYTVTVRVTDDSAAWDEQTYTLDIRNINDAPRVSGTVTPLDVDEDKSLLIELSDIDYTDSDNDAGELTFDVLIGTNYSVNANTITPDLNYYGTLSVNIEISDPDSTTAALIDVTVNPVNDPPVIITFPDEEAWAGQSYSYVFNATDVELDELTYSIPEKPAWLTWVEGIRTLSGTPDFSDIGIDTLTIRVSDGSDNTDSTFYIIVNTENNIPHITSTPLTEINEDELYMYLITYQDDDPGDDVTLSYIMKPGWLTLNVTEQTLSGVPANDQVGLKADSTYVVQLRVSDTKQDSTQTFTITVTNINDAPEILGQTGPILANIGVAKEIILSNVDVVDVDNNLEDLTLTVLPGDGYTIAGNDITLTETEEVLVPVNIRVTDPADSLDEGILNVTVLDNTGIEDLNESNSLVEKVYPVPAGEYLRFVVNSLYDYTLEIIDITGKIIFEEEYTMIDKMVEINTDNWPSGLYIFKVRNKFMYQVGRITISAR